ncbi:hypothetical protein H8Z55_12470 [Mycobacteroides abscessus]|uniref:PASTA domain-containing protein n=3 Tax=Mycobacteroides abscessus TaxID=36809 RepID=A0A829PRY4_9MYCO|nr:hypothetical protein [Mycobacteroides abscessus]EHC00988.1 hypothetical protein MAB47J26_05725 [Mycobacteroides abscessus 47J26]EHM18154.1 hypothetical protein MMAS_26130 [Mycobacteroides abscessus subsp. massiliense CCUG 48898 = JCM 15300]EIC66129.1 hypothetical protein OUW_10794 [Mycobacteroides abscessus M93]EIC69804.1 hypothetical protein S7W_09303 [Mycobacteroides abscessus M94]EIU44600.1 hypothetical protein MA5S1215_4762 [Mycobacteroides abscessus 5S-1215]EIU46744.1 hypothetical pro
MPVLLTAATGLSLITAINALAVPANDADAVINSLQASGYRVTVTRIGSGHQDNCVVQSVNQQSPVSNVASARDMRNRPTSVPVSTKVAHVTLAC